MKIALPNRIGSATMSALDGLCLLQFGSCTSQQIKTQFAYGLSNTLNCIVHIATTDLASEVFDVDD